MRTVTGFHAIEEALRAATEAGSAPGFRLLYTKPGPRVKKILQTAGTLAIPADQTTTPELDRAVAKLPETARDHRGIVLIMDLAEEKAPLSFTEALAELAIREQGLVLLLDSITDPHNVGAIIRSADQFGVDLVVLPDHRGASDPEIIARASAGAASWVPVVRVPNLVRAAEQLKDAGFWVFGADAGGKAAKELEIPEKAALIMGSEGTGISRLLRETCDTIVSIPTRGKLDSLNVSVAAGILLYEIRR